GASDRLRRPLPQTACSSLGLRIAFGVLCPKPLARDRREGLACRGLRRGVPAPNPRAAASVRAAHPRTIMSFALTDERERALREILARYPTKMAACIPALHLCQEQNGWITDEICEYVAKRLELSGAHVKGVATFYTLFNKHPVGKHQVW